MRRSGGYWCWKRQPGSRAGLWERLGELEGSGETSSLKARAEGRRIEGEMQQR